ncbi:MAG: serine/threonine-protein kinase [Parachlamydiales bacterium]|jgi:serine/threonine protein kinase
MGFTPRVVPVYLVPYKIEPSLPFQHSGEGSAFFRVVEPRPDESRRVESKADGKAKVALTAREVFARMGQPKRSALREEPRVPAAAAGAAEPFCFAHATDREATGAGSSKALGKMAPEKRRIALDLGRSIEGSKMFPEGPGGSAAALSWGVPTLFISPKKGEKAGKEYRLIEKLGAGAFGEVYLGQGPDRKCVAIKIIKKGARFNVHLHQRVLKEKDFLELVQTEMIPNVVQLFDAEVKAEAKDWFFVFEYLTGENLFSFYRRKDSLHLADIQNIAANLFLTFQALHRARVVHGDVKPENVIYSEFNEIVTLIDFGNAFFLGEKRDDMVSTICYRAFEIFFGQGSRGHCAYGPEIDMWSLGCMLAELYLKKPLFAPKPFDKYPERYENLETFRDLMAQIMALLGRMEDLEGFLAADAKRFSWFFQEQGFLEDGRVNWVPYVSYPQSQSLKELIRQKAFAIGDNVELAELFADLIGRLVCYKNRLSAEEALKTPFFQSVASAGLSFVEEADGFCLPSGGKLEITA